MITAVSDPRSILYAGDESCRTHLIKPIIREKFTQQLDKLGLPKS